MFKKRICKRCGNKISNDYKFCPYCGNPSNEKSEDLGMLGKNDFMPSNNEIKLPMGLGMIFNSLMKNLNKQFSELDKEMKTKNNKRNPFFKQGLSISIATSGNMPPEIMVNSFKNNPKQKQQIKQMPLQNLSQETLEKISTLPKQEPLTNIRRLADKVIYEINVPEVSSIKDVSIIKLENSIEIKAFAKDKVYVKLIPINLPITNYELSHGKLILELGVRN